MNLAEDKSKRPWSYADYLAIESDERFEVEAGNLVCMASPSPQHQNISAQIAAILIGFLKGGRCRVYPDLDTRLFPELDDDENFIYRPDVSVVCELKQIDNRGCNGAPTLTVEVISPSSATRDCMEKYNAYKKAGVKEYWIIDTMNKEVRLCVLPKGETIIFRDGSFASVVFPGLEISLEEIFADLG